MPSIPRIPSAARNPGALRDTRSARLYIACLLLGAILVAAATPASAARCLTQEMRKLEPAGRTFDPTAVRTHQPGDRMTPPDNPQLGDSWDWYVWHFVGGPPHTHIETCTVRGLGENVYVMVSDAVWGTYVDQADADQIVANFDNSSYGPFPNQGIYQLNTENFGQPPDALDQDPRIYVLLYDWDTSQADGYWNVGDEYPDSPGNPSNECEVVYVDASTSDPGGPGGPYLTAVMSHEFEHMIHWNADSNESSWVDEGMAELAMWLYGRPDAIIGFPGAPDNCVTDFTGSTADYIKCYLFSLYFYEHFGGQQAVFNLVANPANSYLGYQATLTQLGYTTTFAELLADWVTANFLDDPNIEGGRFNYAGANLPTFASVLKSTYPVPPTNAAVDNFAADYVKFINGQPQQLNFDGYDSSTWSIRMIKYLAGTPLSVEQIPLDAAQAGHGYLFDFGTAYDQVVMVVADTAPGASQIPYVYSTEAISAAVDSPPILAGGLRIEEIGANPSNAGASLRLVLDQATDIEASVHDSRGRLVTPLLSGRTGAGTHELRWDGHDRDGRSVAQGIYFLRVHAVGGETINQRVTILR